MKEKQDDPLCCGQRAERWRPEHHGCYFILLGNGTVQSFRWHNTEFDYQAWSYGNCFRRRRDAEQVREQIKEVLLTFHREQAKLCIAKP